MSQFVVAVQRDSWTTNESIGRTDENALLTLGVVRACYAQIPNKPPAFVKGAIFLIMGMSILQRALVDTHHPTCTGSGTRRRRK